MKLSNNEILNETVTQVLPFFEKILTWVLNSSSKLSIAVFHTDSGKKLFLFGISIVYVLINFLVYYIALKIWDRRIEYESDSHFLLYGIILDIIAVLITAAGVYSYKSDVNKIGVILIFAASAIIEMIIIIKCIKIHGFIKGIFMSAVILGISIITQYTMLWILLVVVLIFILCGIFGLGTKSSSSDDETPTIYSESDFTENSSSNDSGKINDWYDRREYVHDNSGNQYKVGHSKDFVEDKNGNWHRVHRDSVGDPYMDNYSNWDDEDNRLL